VAGNKVRTSDDCLVAARACAKPERFAAPIVSGKRQNPEPIELLGIQATPRWTLADVEKKIARRAGLCSAWRGATTRQGAPLAAAGHCRLCGLGKGRLGEARRALLRRPSLSDAGAYGGPRITHPRNFFKPRS
jgi:hypothetical protein